MKLIGIDYSDQPSVSVYPMRHRWHMVRNGKHLGEVVCLRCGARKIRSGLPPDRSCGVKARSA